MRGAVGWRVCWGRLERCRTTEPAVQMYPRSVPETSQHMSRRAVCQYRTLSKGRVCQYRTWPRG
eukprot:949377-Rhodomonas_salina.2